MEKPMTGLLIGLAFVAIVLVLLHAVMRLAGHPYESE